MRSRSIPDRTLCSVKEFSNGTGGYTVDRLQLAFFTVIHFTKDPNRRVGCE